MRALVALAALTGVATIAPPGGHVSDSSGPTRAAAADPIRSAASSPQSPVTPPVHLDRLTVPPGFRVALYAEGLDNGRSLALGDAGTLFVGTYEKGQVYAARDEDGDGRAERVFPLVGGLEMSNGVAFHDGDLYVAEVSRVWRYRDIESRLDDPPPPEVLRSDLPTERHNGWKYLGVGPDDLLYFQIGMPCNVCEPEDPRYGTIMRMRPDGERLEIYASGIRNSLGFDWQPGTGDLWFTDNGRDRMGDDRPPDELNRAPRPGLHFGFPYCHGDDVPDPRYGALGRCDQFEPPALELPPHVAALGMRFYTGGMFPSDYVGDILVAEHGSWDRTTPVGYRVMRVEVDGAQATGYAPFVEGWLEGEEAWGRPVDVLVMPDGSVLVSDDQAGVVYRVTYDGDVSAGAP